MTSFSAGCNKIRLAAGRRQQFPAAAAEQIFQLHSVNTQINAKCSSIILLIFTPNSIYWLQMRSAHVFHFELSLAPPFSSRFSQYGLSQLIFSSLHQFRRYCSKQLVCHMIDRLIRSTSYATILISDVTDDVIRDVTPPQIIDDVNITAVPQQMPVSHPTDV